MKTSDEIQKEIFTEKIKNQYYIDPLGKIHKWKWGVEKHIEEWVSTHAGIASKLYPKLKYPEDRLYDLGWIAVGSQVYGSRVKDELTQAQINTLNRLGFYQITSCTGKKYKIQR